MENENIDWKAQNVWKKWAYVEKTLASMNIKKSGFVKLGENEYGNKNGYDYFQLQDFLPELIRDVCYEVGVVFYTSFEGEDGNTAVTTIVNTDKPEERIVVQSKMPATPSFENDKRYDYKSRSYIPLSGEQKAQKVIKLEGAKQTYFRRYNLVNALNLSETDAIEAESNETNSISGDNACGTEKLNNASADANTKKKLIELYKSIPEGSTKSWHYKECKKWFDGEYGDRKMAQDEALFFIRALEPLSNTNNKEI
jgi:hypothetical protein